MIWYIGFDSSASGCQFIGSLMGSVLVRHLHRITFDPQVMGGRACVRGMRVPVSLVVNLVADGMRTEDIIEHYPYLKPEDISQALKYVAWLAEESVYALEPKAT